MVPWTESTTVVYEFTKTSLNESRSSGDLRRGLNRAEGVSGF
jgi:hypothetical protein